MLANTQTMLPELEYLDLSNNQRISTFGLKYLFSNIIKRLENNKKFNLILMKKNDLNKIND